MSSWATTSTKERVTHILDPASSPHTPLFLPRIHAWRRGVDDDGDAENEDIIRTFTLADIDRVMDYPNLIEPPSSCVVMHCEAPGSGIDGNNEGMDGAGGETVLEDDSGSGLIFPKRFAKLVGGYIFITKPRLEQQHKITANDELKKAANAANAAVGATTTAGGGEVGLKIGCIPLQGCTVEFPPGGRRVFREHAHTGARKGYEMAIRVKVGKRSTTSISNDNAAASDTNNNTATVMTCYIILDSLGQRESWASAVRARCDIGHNKLTLLRPGGIAGSRLMSVDDSYYNTALSDSILTRSGDNTIGIGGGGKGEQQQKKQQSQYGSRGELSSLTNPSSLTVHSEKVSSGNVDLDAAIENFGISGFKEEKWVNDWLRQHPVSALPDKCDQLEKWSDVIKSGLRGAVLEQYEYFVEASREMLTMGREVAWIRTLVERQQETIMCMRNIDFGAGFEEIEDGIGGGGDDGYGYISDDDDGVQNMMDDKSYQSSVVSDSSDDDNTNPRLNTITPMKKNMTHRRETSRKTIPLSQTDEYLPSPTTGVTSTSTSIVIPPWITDVSEEVLAFIKESRYSDATDLILKAKAEVSDILAMHGKSDTPPIVVAAVHPRGVSTAPTASLTASSTGTTTTPLKILHKKHQAFLQRTNLLLDSLMERMSKRLAENLRRKNEALKASAKRERADPLSNLAPLVSPVCLNDDAVALHLLVKLGKYQEAATAFAARRSLLLSECLHERPISSPVGMDAVIYAAQISSSFFSSLATAVEGFLDLFIDSDIEKNGGGGNDDDNTSLNSRTFADGAKRIPSGALSAIVLWCDSELAKFTNVFGSSRLLGNLALSPPGLKRSMENVEKASKVSLAKEREHSIEVAAKCVNQAFAFATENLDTIGLPLTPKLSEYMRPKLKGCDAEVASLLDPRWKALAYEWFSITERNMHDIRPMITPRPLADDRRV